jgi:site-specific recombinase XerD
MGALARRMKSQMELRGLSPRTIEVYLQQVSRFVQYVGHAPERIDAEEIRGYLHHLLTQRRVSQATMSQAYSALRLFYEQVLGKAWEERTIPRAKQRHKLPLVLTPSEIESLFAATRRLKYRALFMVIYSGGLRVSEATHLQLQDIDSQRMLIRVRHGKGQKDRYTLLSKRALETLRGYWRHARPETWLFPGLRVAAPLRPATVQRTFKGTVKAAGIKKAATPHTLRHSFATHLLESGVSLHHIQRLLGHRQSSTTALYLHLTHGDLARITNPMDEWPALDAPAS